MTSARRILNYPRFDDRRGELMAVAGATGSILAKLAGAGLANWRLHYGLASCTDSIEQSENCAR